MNNLPLYLKPGDTIGITAPSFGCTTEPYISRFKEACRHFREMGYKLKIGETVTKDDGLGISTDPAVCARELVEFFTDPEIKCIISAGGGELMCETVGNIDFDSLKNLPPKWYVGYSDNTNFIHPIVTKCNGIGIYAQCISGFGKPWEQAEEQTYGILTGKSLKVNGFPKFQLPEAGTEAKAENPLSPYVLTEEKILKYWLPENDTSLYIDGSSPVAQNTTVTARGTVLGGCLDVLNNLAGTPLEETVKYTENKKIIWCLEACDCNPMDIRRDIWHLDQCGWFKTAAAFVIGRPLAAWMQDWAGVNQYNAVIPILKKYKVPIILDADIGHISPDFPLIIGAQATLTARGNSIQFDWS